LASINETTPAFDTEIILRYCMDSENGDLYRAPGRYNDSLGKPEFPNLVVGTWKSCLASGGTG
jgi:hypothetical protein